MSNDRQKGEPSASSSKPRTDVPDKTPAETAPRGDRALDASPFAHAETEAFLGTGSPFERGETEALLESERGHRDNIDDDDV